ncbi:MAG: DUF5819 family protein [Kofleriaceae bacterium]
MARAGITRVLPGILGGVLVLHFAITLVYLTPLNPIKIELLPYVSQYMQPFFQQRWDMFAPNPLVDTRMLLISCRTKNEHGELEERPWSNMTAPLRAQKERYRLTPADRIDRAQMAAIHLLYEKPDVLADKLINTPEDTPEYKSAVELIERERKAKEALGTDLMARVASAECDRLYGPAHTTAVRTRMVVIKSPPFSKRWSSAEQEGQTSYVDFDWLAYQSVAPL